MTERDELVHALREAMSALDACLNSSDLAAALEEADQVLTTYRPLLKRLAAVPTSTERRSTMDSAQALAVVRSLANGVDPETGEVFPAEGAYQRPQTVRALYQAVAALESMEKRARRMTQLPAKTGEPWTEDEDRKLLAAFDAGRALGELAAAHQRTQTGIRARLVKYGRLAA